MEEMKQAKTDYEAWKPEMNNRVSDLEHAVNYLGERMEHFFSDKSKQPATGEVQSPHSDLDSDPKSASADKAAGFAHLGPSLSEASSGPCGHRHETHHRSTGFGVVYTIPDPPPATGANAHHKSVRYYVDDDSTCCDQKFHTHHSCNHLPPGALSDFPFPSFDGSNPRLWVTKAESYFDIYSVDSYKWVKLLLCISLGLLVFGYTP